MTNKYNLLLDAAKLMRSLVDVVEAIAETYNDTVLTVDVAEVIQAEEPKQIEEKKEEKKTLSFEEVRAVLAAKSREGHTAEVKAVLTEFGVEKLSDINPDQYDALLAKVEVI